jgi:hypothetical protein
MLTFHNNVEIKNKSAELGLGVPRDSNNKPYSPKPLINLSTGS